MFLEPFGQDLQITEVVCASQHLTATLLKDPKSVGAKKERYFLSIQAIKGITPGTVLTNDNPDQLTLKINHPQVPELKFNVRYVVN